jgi:hypothetical protein
MDQAVEKVASIEGPVSRPFSIFVNSLVLMSLCKLLLCNLTALVTCWWAGLGLGLGAGFRLGVEKSPKMPQNPASQVHALLAGECF